MVTDNCSGGQFGYAFPTSWWTDNAGIASIDQSGNITGITRGITGNHGQGILDSGDGVDEGFNSGHPNQCPRLLQTDNGATDSVAIPTHLYFDGPGTDDGQGNLRFVVKWLSTSGQVQDLDHCVVGEIVTYPDSGTFFGSFFWPSPPYTSTPTAPNPTLITVDATLGVALDTHAHNNFVQPYHSNVIDVEQTYRWNCSNYLNGEWVDFSTFTIERSVNQHTFNSNWYYTVVKAGSSAQVDPLP